MNDARGPDDAIDRYLERVARGEEDNINRQHGQSILDAVDARREGTQADAVLSIFNEAWQSEAESTAQAEREE